jgi:hypothetical protein
MAASAFTFVTLVRELTRHMALLTSREGAL